MTMRVGTAHPEDSPYRYRAIMGDCPGSIGRRQDMPRSTPWRGSEDVRQNYGISKASTKPTPVAPALPRTMVEYNPGERVTRMADSLSFVGGYPVA